MEMTNDLPRRDVFCIDSRSFFASVEAVERGLHPLKDLVVVLSNGESDGGLVLSASPAAKKYGVDTTTRKFEIPTDIPFVIVPPRMALYVEKNHQLNQIFEQFTDKTNVVPYSIDESFLDVTDSHRLFGDNWEIATTIQRQIYYDMGLFVAVGIGDNPLLAKLALDNEAKNVKNLKAVWRYEDVQKIWAIPKLTDMWGIGHRTAIKLQKLGIFSVAQLAQADVNLLKDKLGIIGEQLYYHAHGIDYSILSEKYVPKETSYGKSQILEHDYVKQVEIEVVIREMVDQVAARMRRHNVVCQLIHLSVGAAKYEVLDGFSRQMTITETNQSKYLIEEFLSLFRKFYKGQTVRSITISCGKLHEQRFLQFSLFEEAKDTIAEVQLEQTIDKIRERYGYQSLVHASSLTEGATAIKRSNLLGGHQA